MATGGTPVLLGLDLLPSDPADVIFLTRYVGRHDSGIAFTDRFYIEALARSAVSTLVLANRVPGDLPDELVRYTSTATDYRRQQPLVQISNGLGSFHHHLSAFGDGYLRDHTDSLKFAVIHDEPTAYDIYGTSVWNRENVVHNLMPAHDGFIFVSSNCQRAWNEHPEIASKPQFYLPNTGAEESLITESILTVARDDVRGLLGYRDSEINLVVVATVQPRKAQLTAVRAVARLREMVPSAHPRLRIVGRVTKPDYLALVQAEIEALGLSDVVEFVGEVSKERALEHIYAADALVCPSQSEAMPLVLLEAMQLGTPIFATPVGGVTEVVDDDCAHLFEVDDSEMLARLLATLMSDRAAAVGRSQRASERYWAEFSNQRFSQRFSEILREILAMSSSASGSTTPDDLVQGLDLVGDHLEVHASADGSGRRRQRLALTMNPQFRRARTVSLSSQQSSLEGLLIDAAPLLRMGYRVTSFDIGDKRLALANSPGGSGSLSQADVTVLVNGRSHVAGLQADFARRSDESQRLAARDVRRLKARFDRRWTGPRLRRAARRIPGLAPVARLLRPLLPKKELERAPQPAPLTPAALFVFNSPTQMVSALALWDQRLGQDSDLPLVAAVYSTGGAEGFSAELAGLARRTGRFDLVVDITETYKRVYSESPAFGSLVALKRDFREAVAPYAADTLLIAAFMSARAQKMLYETFDTARIRLFEDGLGSYVPKPIKMTDTGFVDRITSGDCAEAYHIRRIESVDLQLAKIPIPPQYAGNVPSLQYPEVRVGAYSVDFDAVARAFEATPRSFPPGCALVVTQNFFDHLGKRGLTVEAEREINDATIGHLLESGRQVIIRPHPRASEDVWSSRWDDDARVEVWREYRGVPVEAIVDSESPPEILVGISSSCLFYMGGNEGMKVRRYADAALGTLARYSTAEYKLMLSMARDALVPLF